MKLKKRIREQKGSITLYVLISMLFFIIVLMGLFVNSNYKMQQQERSVKKIQKSYEKSNIDDLYNETINK